MSSNHSLTSATIVSLADVGHRQPVAHERIGVVLQRARLHEHAVAMRVMRLQALGVVEHRAVLRVGRVAADEALGEVVDDPHGLVEDPLAGLRAGLRRLPELMNTLPPGFSARTQADATSSRSG